MLTLLAIYVAVLVLFGFLGFVALWKKSFKGFLTVVTLVVLLVLVFLAFSEVKKTHACPNPLCDRNCIHYNNSRCDFLSLNVQQEPRFFSYSDRVCVHKDNVIEIFTTRYILTVSNGLFFMGTASLVFLLEMAGFLAIPLLPLLAYVLYKQNPGTAGLQVAVCGFGWLFMVTLLGFFGSDLTISVLQLFEQNWREMHEFFIFMEGSEGNFYMTMGAVFWTCLVMWSTLCSIILRLTKGQTPRKVVLVGTLLLPFSILYLWFLSFSFVFMTGVCGKNR
jgi:hypothetical protein